MILSVMIVAMKRYIILFAASLLLMLNIGFFSFSSEAPLPTRADSEIYAVAENAEVWFYGAENEEEKLFCIPRTYYVKVLSRGETFSVCEYLRDSAPYQKIVGYCLSDSLTFVDFVPKRPFLYREVTVEYILPLHGSIGSGKFTSLKETFVYYGNRYENGQLYFYVGKNGEFDYIPASEELVYELNDDFLPDPEAPVSGTNASEGLSAVQIVLITLSAVAVLVIAVFVARGKRSPAPDNLEP